MIAYPVVRQQISAIYREKHSRGIQRETFTEKSFFVLSTITLLSSLRKNAVEEQNDFRVSHTHLVFVDLTACGSISLAKLRNAIEKQGMSSKNINSVKKLYAGMTEYIEVEGRLSSEITVNKGLKQCCCIAATLFRIYLIEVLTTRPKKRYIISICYYIYMLNEEYTK